MLRYCSLARLTCEHMHIRMAQSPEVFLYGAGICAGKVKGRITAGTVSAVLRELRPVEIVGLYEDAVEGVQVYLP